MSKPININHEFKTLTTEYMAMGLWSCVSDQYDPDIEKSGTGRTRAEAVSDWLDQNCEDTED